MHCFVKGTLFPLFYPFINIEMKGDLYVIDDTNYCDIISYVEHFGMTTI